MIENQKKNQEQTVKSIDQLNLDKNKSQVYQVNDPQIDQDVNKLLKRSVSQEVPTSPTKQTSLQKENIVPNLQQEFQNKNKDKSIQIQSTNDTNQQPSKDLKEQQNLYTCQENKQGGLNLYEKNQNLSSSDSQKGLLRVNIKEANLITQEYKFHHFNPYVVINYKDKLHKTETLEKTGQHPVWNSELQCEIDSIDDEILFVVEDKKPYKDKEIGEISIKISDICKSGIQKLPIKFKDNTPAGELLIEVQFIQDQSNVTQTSLIKNDNQIKETEQNTMNKQLNIKTNKESSIQQQPIKQSQDDAFETELRRSSQKVECVPKRASRSVKEEK